MPASPARRATALLLLAAMLCQGCAGPNAHLQYLLGDHQTLSHYEDMATAIEYPIEQERRSDPALFHTPRTINDLGDVQRRPMTLDQCIREALASNDVIIDDASFGSPANPLLANPARANSVYDTAIQETSFLFGNRGPEAALSDFDALFTQNMQWGRTEDPQNTQFFSLQPGDTLTDDTAQFSSRIEKPFANSGTFSVQHDWNYSSNNVDSRLFQSAYTGFLQGEYRQPLLSGSGTEFTRVAGPISQNLRGVSGVSQGVLISRINTDISMVEFEQSVGTLVRDIENVYWDLYLALQLYDSEIETFEDLIRYWGRAKRRSSTDRQEGTYQAENRIYEADSRIKGSLADVLEKEARLRRLIGRPLSDGEFIMPADKPSESKLTTNWEAALNEAFAHRAELRRQKWEIRSLELQLNAAKNLARPRLDFVSQYRVNGFGDQLFGEEDDDGATDTGYRSAYESLTQGNNTTWNLGFSFSLPLGLRLARAQVRNYEMRLAKTKAVLEKQERDIAYEINNAMLNMDRWYELGDSSIKRLKAARTNLDLLEPRLTRTDNPAETQQLLSQTLEAKISQREAEQAYLRSVVEYNKSIVDLNFRKGMSLQSQSVYLAEGEWNPMAYEDARRRAWATTHALDNKYLKTEPPEFVGGAAASAWESTGNPNRPHVPGVAEAVQPAAPGSNPMIPPAPAANDPASQMQQAPQADDPLQTNPMDTPFQPPMDPNPMIDPGQQPADPMNNPPNPRNRVPNDRITRDRSSTIQRMSGEFVEGESREQVVPAERQLESQDSPGSPGARPLGAKRVAPTGGFRRRTPSPEPR